MMFEVRTASHNMLKSPYCVNASIHKLHSLCQVSNTQRRVTHQFDFYEYFVNKSFAEALLIVI